MSSNTANKCSFDWVCFKMLLDLLQGAPYGLFIHFTAFTRYRSLWFRSKYLYQFIYCFQDPMWRFIKDHRPFFFCQGFQASLSAFFYRKESLETKTVVR